MRRACLGALLLAAAVKGAKKRPTHHENAFGAKDLLDLRIYVSPTPRFSAFNDTEALIWKQEGMEYAAFADHEQKVDVPLTDALLANATLFAHVFVTKAGFSPDPKHGSYDRWATTSNIHELVGYSERLEAKGLHNLISGEPAPWEAELVRGAAEAKAAGRPEGEFISYWKPKLMAQLLVDTEAYAIGEMPPLMLNYLQGYRLVSGHKYRPLVYINELTSMKIHWQAINSSSSSMPLELTFGPLPAKRFQWMVNLQVAATRASPCFVPLLTLLSTRSSPHAPRLRARLTSYLSPLTSHLLPLTSHLLPLHAPLHRSTRSR